ncbi:MAG TPA: histidine kinase [Cytophagaceae bacterium]|jgi:signal transduction histidine kinase
MRVIEGQKDVKNVSRKITRLYIIALSAVAFFSILGQVLVQNALRDLLGDARVVNIAGRQRMLSQKICKTALLLTSPLHSTQTDYYRSELHTAISLWHDCHTGLKKGRLDFLDLNVKNSDTIIGLLNEIDPFFYSIYTHATSLRLEPTYSPASISSLKEIIKNERLFLPRMDKIVFQYDKEAQQRVNKLKTIEWILLLVTLVILMMEGLLIFKPAVGHIKKTILKLMDSEAKTSQMNDELMVLNESLKSKENELYIATQEKYLQQINEQKIRSTSLIKGQENERKRIAREIHDGLGQMLTALKLNVENINIDALQEKEKKTIDDLKQMVGLTIAETRTISFNLMPTVLSDFGVISALKLLAEQAAKNTDTNIRFQCENTFDRLDKNVEIGLYRITQEAINNAIKYAQASEILIGISLKSELIHLTIFDNGKGFNPKKVTIDKNSQKINNGIYNMQERTNLMDGEFKILTGTGKGTKIFCIIPVKYQ